MSFTWALTSEGLRLCGRLLLNVFTSRSCRKYVLCVGLWVAPVCMYGMQKFGGVLILPVGTSPRVPVAKNHCNRWYFYVFSRQLAAEHDSNGFTRHCPNLPHSAAQTQHETIWESQLRFSAEAMTTREFHVLRCMFSLSEYKHSYLYSCTTLSLLCPCVTICFFFYCQFLQFGSAGHTQPLCTHTALPCSILSQLRHMPMSLVDLPSWWVYLHRLPTCMMATLQKPP